MSVARPAARSLFSRRLVSTAASNLGAASPSTSQCRSIHTSSPLAARKRPGHKSSQADELNLARPKDGGEPWSNQRIKEFTDAKFPKYNQEELDELRKIYTDEQIEAIKAAEAAVDPRDLTIQGRLRTDPFRFNYLDDFSTLQPTIDKRPKRQPPPDPLARFMNLDEFTDDLIKWADKFPVGEVTGTLKKLEDFAPEELKDKPEGQWPAETRKNIHEQYVAYLQNQAENNKNGKSDDGGNMLVGPTDADVLEYILQRSSMTDKGLISNSEMAPALPNKVPGVEGMYKNPVDPEDEGMDEEGVYQDLKLRTGMTVQELLGLNVKILARRFVSNQTRLGKVQSLSVTAICGNGNGWLGIGQGKAVEPSHAQTQAILKAMENMKPILRYEDRTTFGNLKCKISGTVVELYSRPPGFGLRVPHHIFEIARAAGIQDLAAKIPRSRNPMNTVKAAVEALQTQRHPEEIAMGRGKKLVDVRKVYYGGQVY